MLLDTLEVEYGPGDPLPSTDGWELVLAENIGYLVADDRRWAAMARLKRTVGLAPERILAASDDALAAVVVGARPFERVARLRRCAELAIAGAQWRHYPGIGQPGVERIQLFTAISHGRSSSTRAASPQWVEDVRSPRGHAPPRSPSRTGRPPTSAADRGRTAPTGAPATKPRRAHPPSATARSSRPRSGRSPSTGR